MNMQRWLPPALAGASLSCFIAVVSSNGSAHALEAGSRYRTVEIPYAAHQMTWMDNDNVLFAGMRMTREGGPDRRPTWGPQALYRWNIRTGEVAELMKTGEGVGVLCYDRGYIHVAFIRGNERVIREGSLGQQKETVHNRREAPPLKGSFSPYNCRYREVPAPTQSDRGVTTVLRDDHGFIEAERPSESFPQRKYFLVHPSGQQIVLKNFHGGPGGPRFSEFRQSYIFQDGGGLAGPNVERQIRAVGIDGTVIAYKLPKGQWMRGTVYGMPVRDATLMVSLSTVAKAEGAYLVKGEQAELLLRGYVGSFAVSPNGCKAAMSIGPGAESDVAASRNIAVNICKGEK